MVPSRSASTLVSLLLVGILAATGAVTAFSERFQESADPVLLDAGADEQLVDAQAEPAEPDEFREQATGAVAAQDPGQEPAPARARAASTVGRRHYAQLSEDGWLPGRLSLIDPATGRLVASDRTTVLFLQDGRIITQARAGTGGVFQAALAPGVYSLIATGEEGLFASGIHVLPYAATAVPGADRDAVAPLAAGSPLRIDGLLVSPPDVPLAARVLASDVVTAQLPPAPRIGYELTAARRDAPIVSLLDGAAAVLPAHRQIRGRLVRPMSTGGALPAGPDSRVVAIQDGTVVGEFVTDADGWFEIPGLEPGLHGLSVSGPDGVAAGGIQVVADAWNVPAGVAGQAEPLADDVILEVALCEPVDLMASGFALGGPACGHPGCVAGMCGMPMCGWPMFGGFGGGGGFGHDGLLAGLLGAGLGAGLAAALLRDRDRRRRDVVTPFAVAP